MNQTIWKFELTDSDEQQIEMPEGAQILSVQMQNNKPCLWALVNPDPQIKKEKRIIELKGTGHAIYGTGRTFIGTFQWGDFVGHVFEYIG